MLVNGDEWARWGGYHIPVSKEYIVIWTPIGTSMYWKPGTWISHKHQLSYLFPNAWFTIHVGYTETGSFLSGYCDVVLPNADYTNTAKELIYTDLYIDVVIRQDVSVFTKDQEVFARAAHRYPIVEESRQQAFAALDWLEEHARHWSGPFAVIPRRLPRTDWDILSIEEIRAEMRSALQQQQQQQS